jgi:hypothetical protein
MIDDMDINCGIIDGVSLEQKRASLISSLKTAGEKSKTWKFGHGDNEYVPWFVGAVIEERAARRGRWSPPLDAEQARDRPVSLSDSDAKTSAGGATHHAGE